MIYFRHGGGIGKQNQDRSRKKQSCRELDQGDLPVQQVPERVAAGKKCQNGTRCKECAAVIQGIAGMLFPVGEKIQEQSQGKEEDKDDENSESPGTPEKTCETYNVSLFRGPRTC